jgi:hypothetical protein
VDRDLGFFFLAALHAVGKISFFPKRIGLHDEISTDHDQPTLVVGALEDPIPQLCGIVFAPDQAHTSV